MPPGALGASAATPRFDVQQAATYAGDVASVRANVAGYDRQLGAAQQRLADRWFFDPRKSADRARIDELTLLRANAAEANLQEVILAGYGNGAAHTFGYGSGTTQIATFGQTLADNGGYGHGVGEVFVGYKNAGVGTAQGLWQTVRHPVQTAQGVYQAVRHPVQTGQALYADITEKSRSLAGQGELIGDILLGLAGGGVTKAAKESKHLSQLAKVVKDKVPGVRAPTRTGADLTISRPAILNNQNLSVAERAVVEKSYRVKTRAIQSAARRGELTFSPGTDAVRISELQVAHRTRVIERFERMFGTRPNLTRLDTDHPVDLIIGGPADHRLKLIHRSINRSIGSSLRNAAERAGLQPGAAIRSINIDGGF